MFRLPFTDRAPQTVFGMGTVYFGFPAFPHFQRFQQIQKILPRLSFVNITEQRETGLCPTADCRIALIYKKLESINEMHILKFTL